jgi:hypothetical protein
MTANHNKVTPDTRTTGELILFALGFIGFWLGAVGIVTLSAGCAITGGVLFLITLAGFGLKGG